MNGTVLDTTPDWRGATLLTAVGSVLTVDDVADFDEEGGWLTIADAAPLEYVAVDEDADTVTLSGTAGTVEAGDPVAIWDPTVPPSGAKVVEYLASVMTDRGPVDAVIEHEKVPLAGVDTLVGASVSLTEDTYGTPYVDQVLGREAVIDGASVDLSTADVSVLPPPPLTDGNAPTAATTVTPIGGIGSMFYRWTEITNNDPVTYRLHVRAGSAPTTTGTYEVAAGVGLTSAAVRKLKDGTAIVGDGTVTYHAIVTVEDADGPGPASSDATGIPAQINTPDINVNALTANMLTANDVLADAVNATDFTGVTMTAPLIRTSATGNRLELTNADELRFYSGVVGELAPGKVWASIPGGQGSVLMESPKFSATAGKQSSILLQAGSSSTDPLVIVDAGTGVVQEQGTFIQWVDWATGGQFLQADSASTAIWIGTGYNLRSKTGGFSIGGNADGSVGTGTFRDSVDARANAMSAARMQTGTASSGTVVAATTKTVTVTFPTAFSSAPKVTLTGLSSDPGVDRRVAVVPGSETTTQFQVAFWRATGTASFDTNWLAVKP